MSSVPGAKLPALVCFSGMCESDADNHVAVILQSGCMWGSLGCLSESRVTYWVSDRSLAQTRAERQ